MHSTVLLLHSSTVRIAVGSCGMVSVGPPRRREKMGREESRCSGSEEVQIANHARKQRPKETQKRGAYNLNICKQMTPILRMLQIAKAVKIQ